jgi:glutaredoxin
MPRLFALFMLCFALPLAVSSADPTETEPHGYTLEFYTGKWCGACQRVKHYLKLDNSAEALTLRLADGSEMIVPIVEVDVPTHHNAARYEAGATDIYGQPRIPQFQVKLNGERTDAFIFNWPTERYSFGVMPKGFSAAKTLGSRLATGLKLDAEIIIPESGD